jgi:hypothetical protein
MYLFVRRARLAGGQTRASMMWATEITERVNQVTDIGCSLHAQVLSADVGELVWAAMMPDLATFEAATEKLQADDFYIAEQDRAHGFMVGPPTDSLHRLVHGELTELPPGSYATSVTAICAAGQMAAGFGVAVEIADRVTAITGTPTLLMTSETGRYGEVMWTSTHPGIQSLEASSQALADDAGFVSFIDERAHVFAPDPDVTRTAIYRRLM